MLRTGLFGNESFVDNLMDDFFDIASRPIRSAVPAEKPIRSDIVEKDDCYEISMSVPGVSKENIEVELKDGYLKVTAKTDGSDETEEKSENVRYIRRERYSGTASRTFRVNEYVTQEDISAKHENGILTIRVAKIDKEKREAENKKLISIEG